MFRFLPPPAGLSKLQAIRVSGKSPLKGNLLVRRKLGLLNVLANLNIPSEVVYPCWIAASVDSNDRITKKAEELLKRKAAGVNLEDPTLVKQLFTIFQGTLGDGIATEVRVSPASPTLKAKLMGIFTHSIAAANSFPATLHCIFDCIYGNESYPRLKQAGMEFSVWVFKHAVNEQIKHMAPIILSGILKLLDKQVPGEADSFSKQLRTFAYQAIGQLGQRVPHLFSGNTDIAVRLFGAFKMESPSLRFTVQEAATSLASIYRDCNEEIAKQLDSLLLSNIQAVQGEARFCAVWWANHVHDFRHCASRFICMLGASDERLDIRDMALEGLNPSKQDASGQSEYPQACDMLEFIYQQQPKLLAAAEIGEQELLFPSKTYISMITFILKCYEADDSLPFEGRLCLLLEHAMASNGSVELHAKASSGLLAVASKTPQKFMELYCNRIQWLRQFLGHVDSMTRETVARLLGIVSSGLSTPAAVDLLQDLRSTFQKGRFEDMHGAICAAGYVLAQCMTGVPSVPDQIFRMVISNLVKVGRSGSPGLSGSVAEAIGHVGVRGPLHIMQTSSLDGPEDRAEAASGIEAAGEEVNLQSVIQLFNDVICSNEVKSVQKAVTAYGHLCFGNPDTEIMKEALNTLLELSRSTVEDVLFSVGEAISFIWDGLSITADDILKSSFMSLSNVYASLGGHVQSHNDAMDASLVSGGANDERAMARETVVHKLFDELLFSSRKEERCAGAVWMVSIITYCGRHPRVQQMLPEIQEAFSHLLGDQNDLTQEMASRGMSILYDLGDTSTRDELVKALVSTLSGTSKRKRAVKLTEDTEVFEEGLIGEKPGGGKISTYKEICNLANEMGQPDLIYKFMDLANHQASFNSKRGAAFGFAKIAKQAGDALHPYLRSLVPKLIRYQYDPNKHIQDAMGHIWRSIVAEPKKAVDEFFDDIMVDLLSQAGSRIWRSRESSCLALADILQGRRFHEVNKYLEQIWTVCFRAMDDIKETVRTAGVSLSRSVSSLTLRLGDTNLTAEADARATIAIVFPFLLSKGILSSIVDVQSLSINTVMKLAKNAGSSLRPQLPDLIVCMLESLSSLEDQRLNYAELHAEKAGISTEKLESLRITIAKDSPMWETLDICLQQVDSQTLQVLVPRLIQLVRSGVGLNTRVGVAKFISLLTQHVGSNITPYAGILLTVLKTAVQNEKSTSSSRAFASTCATVVKHAGHMQVKALFEEAVTLYHSSAAKSQITSALLLKELSHQASEIFAGYHAVVLPVAFVARFEEEKDVRSYFEDIWEENTSTEGVALQFYTSDIVPLALEGLSSTSWTQKKKSAKAIARLAEAGGDSIVPFVQPLTRVILEELPGRLWEGKEVLLDALSAICKSCNAVIPKDTSSDTISRHEIIEAVLTACTRKKSVFRNAAFSCLEQILLHFKDPDLFKDTFPFLLQCCMPSSKEKETVTAQHSQDEEPENAFTPLEKALPCLRSLIITASSPVVSANTEAIVACVVAILYNRNPWQVNFAALTVAQAFVGHVQKENKGDEQENICITKSLESLLFTVLERVSSTEVGQVRIACLECVVTMLEVAHFRLHVIKTFEEDVSKQLLRLYESEKNAAAKSLIQSILDTIHCSTDISKT